MAEELLVGNTLTNEMIQFGNDFISLLDKKKFSIDAALWFYYPNIYQWRLILSMPEVNVKGPKVAYQKIQNALKKLDFGKISLQQIHILDMSDPLIMLLKSAIKTGKGISGIRFTQNTINGILIEDAYIYRLV